MPATMLGTVKKIGPVLALFTEAAPEWRMSDVSRELGMSLSATHELMRSLTEVGLLSRTPDGRYRLGWRLMTLSARIHTGVDVRAHATAAMQALASRIGETVVLATLDRHNVVYVHCVDSEHPWVRVAETPRTQRLPAQAVAEGKVLLAGLSDLEVGAHMYSAEWPRLTDRTIVDLVGLAAHLEKVRATGLGFDLCESTHEVIGVAAAVLNEHGTTVAAIGVRVPAYRFPKEPSTLVSALRATCRDVSARVADAARERPLGAPCAT